MWARKEICIFLCCFALDRTDTRPNPVLNFGACVDQPTAETPKRMENINPSHLVLLSIKLVFLSLSDNGEGISGIQQDSPKRRRNKSRSEVKVISPTQFFMPNGRLGERKNETALREFGCLFIR
mmetsp:Transcript_10165/g.11078  ORF Transcript_10165/g.11078 Transcript_10165/m.11078 type:complete len:124 (-) Transcript_10165:316-687(-)